PHRTGWIPGSIRESRIDSPIHPRELGDKYCQWPHFVTVADQERGQVAIRIEGSDRCTATRPRLIEVGDPCRARHPGFIEGGSLRGQARRFITLAAWTLAAWAWPASNRAQPPAMGHESR